MRLFKSLSITVLGFLMISPVVAQENSTVKVMQLTEKVYLLTTDQGAYTTNSIAFVGDDGLLLIDTQAKNDVEALKKVLDSFGKGIPKYIINTHRHVEHIGGNAIFGEEPVVIAHELVPSKLKSGSFIFDEYPNATYPDITVVDSLSLYFNGEKIRIFSVAGSHDDNEIAVHFTESKVAHVSSIVNGFNFPSIDSDGDIFKFPEIIEKAIGLLPEDVVIVSGHNPPGKYEEFHGYLDMFKKAIEAVKVGLEAEKDAVTLKDEKILDEWKSYAGSYVSVDGMIDNIVNGFQKKEQPVKKKIFEPIYYALKEGGVDAGIEKYHQLKNDHSDEYSFSEMALFIIPYKLFNNEKFSDAGKFLELCIEEYPDWKYSYYYYEYLGQVYLALEDKELALKNFKKSLEINPENTDAAKAIEELEEN